MISTTLANLSNELRQAAARRDYAAVERLAASAGEAAAEEAKALPAGDARFDEIAAWLRELYESAEILVRIGRTAQADEFRRLLFLRRYLPGAVPQPPRVLLQL